jgi:formamidopyrimidine-DNA glycosylase
MPEVAELESYRRLARRAIGREIARVRVRDPRFLKRGLTARALGNALRGREFDRVRRIGKLLVFRVAPEGREFAVHLGMTGHLVVDGRDVAGWDAVAPAEPGSWDRVILDFRDGGGLRVEDRRRLGGIMLDPDLKSMGPDISDLTQSQLESALAGSSGPLKARLLDQSRIAGVGNLTADEALWRAGLDPARPAGSLDRSELRRLHRCLADTARNSIGRGRTRDGPFAAARSHGGRCPRDGTPLERRRVAGRTTWSCPSHQH